MAENIIEPFFQPKQLKKHKDLYFMATFFIYIGIFCILGAIINLIYSGPTLPFFIIGIITLSVGFILEDNKPKKEQKQTKKNRKKIASLHKEHSFEAYKAYMNLKDYPTTKNPNYKNSETYKAVILFIQRMYIIAKNTNGDPYEVKPIQLANLIMHETKEKFENQELFITTLNAYVTYYFMLDESSLHKNLSNDFETNLVNDIIFQLRQKFVEKFSDSALNDEETAIPHIEDILAEIFNEKDIIPSII